MSTEKSLDEVIINDCKHLGEHNEVYSSEESGDEPSVHYDCNEKVLSQQSRCCMFPDYVRRPNCCIEYISGGEPKVKITKLQLTEYYKEELESTIPRREDAISDALRNARDGRIDEI